MNSVIEPNLSGDTDGIDFRGLLHDLIEQKWLVMTIVFISLAFGCIYLIKKTPLYKSDVLIQVDSKQNSLGGLASLGQQLNMSSSADDSSIQIALIQSRFILAPVVEALGLNIVGAPYQASLLGRFFPSKDKIHVGRLEVPQDYYNKKLQLVMNTSNHFNLFDEDHHFVLEGNIGELVTNKNHTFALRIDDVQAKSGAKFTLVRRPTNSIAESLASSLKIVDTGSQASGAQKTGVLQVSLTDADPRKVVNILNELVKVLLQKNVEKKSLEAAKTLEFLKQQAPIVKNDLEQADAKLNIYRAKTGKIDIKIQTEDLLRQLAELDKQLQELHLTKADMFQQDTPDHPYMIAINNKIAVLEEDRNKLQRELSILPASDQIAINLMREVKVKNDLYIALLQKMQELQVTKASTMSDVRILSVATIPDAPLSKKSKIVLASCFIMGLILAGLIVSAKKMFSNTIADALWIERHLSLVNLAIIPFSKQQKRKFTAWKSDPGTKDLQILAAESPNDLSIEALRSLRTSLQIMLLSATNNIVSIMGATPGIGKSFVAANFVYLLAQAGKRVLLIDGDIRRGHLQDYFQVPRAPGLTDLINGSATLEDALRKVQHENLTFLSTGTIPENPSELLTHAKLKEIIETVSSQFDLVIIDTAPVLAVTDGVLLGALSGTNLLVVGSDKHQGKELEVAMKRVTSAGVKIHGSIFNHLKEEAKIKGNTRYNYHYAYESEKTN